MFTIGIFIRDCMLCLLGHTYRVVTLYATTVQQGYLLWLLDKMCLIVRIDDT